jgi:hypothetical protein
MFDDFSPLKEYRGARSAAAALNGPALGVKRYHALVAEALMLRKLATTIYRQLERLQFATEVHLEAWRLEKSARRDQLQEIYLQLLQEHLDLAEALVTAAQDVADQQMRFVEQRCASGQDTEAALKNLNCIVQAKQYLIIRRDSFRRELAN